MQRDLSLDLARGFTVLCIPAIHSLMAFSDPAVYDTWLGIPLEWIAQGPGAQLFMLLMGMGVAFKSPRSCITIIRRATLLLAAGYALNILKFGLPLLMNVLPYGVQKTLLLSPGWKGVLQAALIGDILHFAALAWIIICAMRRLTDYWFWSAVVAIIILFLSPLTWDIHSGHPVLAYTFSLLVGQPPRVFFPVFPWIIYPLIGLTIGTCWQRNPRTTAIRCGIIGIVLIITGQLYASIFDEHTVTGFYRTLPGETIWHVGIVLVTLFVWKRIANNLPPNPFFNLLQFCSRHITTLYLVQWVFICWLLPLAGYQTMNTLESFFMCGYTTAVILCITALFHKHEPFI
jgi:hypothetical protein